MVFRQKLSVFQDFISNRYTDFFAIVSFLFQNLHGYDSLDSALSAFTSENDVFELFTDIKNRNLATSAQFKINMPANATFDGHGYTLSGNISIFINTNGGKINNVRFYDITNNAQRTAEQIERYENDGAGTLTVIYGSKLAGTASITNCIFDTNNWESIQITPVAGAKIVINNNVFKHAIKTWQENRNIHIESASNGVDFNVEIRNNDFYDTATTLTNQSIEVYYMSDRSKLIIDHNFISDYSVSVLADHVACLGLKKISGSGFDWIANLDAYNMSIQPNN